MKEKVDCHNCIYYRMCEFVHEFYETECDDFKNKADFVEVVRCRECKHCEIWDNDCYFCKETVNNAEVKADDYCSYGEKREGQCRFEDRMDEKEIAEIKWAIGLIDDYVREPNSISAEWYKVLKLCRRALREKVK